MPTATIYIVEDQPGGSADIWFAKDVDGDGMAESVSRWATMPTVGAEPTGLYFDVTNPNIAFINVKHTSSGVDRLLQISAVPEPESYALMLTGLAVIGAVVLWRPSRTSAGCVAVNQLSKQGSLSTCTVAAIVMSGAFGDGGSATQRSRRPSDRFSEAGYAVFGIAAGTDTVTSAAAAPCILTAVSGAGDRTPIPNVVVTLAVQTR